MTSLAPSGTFLAVDVTAKLIARWRTASAPRWPQPSESPRSAQDAQDKGVHDNDWSMA